LVKYGKEEYQVRLSSQEEQVIEFISKKLANGKRIHELELLSRTMEYHHGIINLLKQSLQKKYDISLTEHSAKNVVNVMTNQFPSGTGKNTYSDCIFLEEDKSTGDYNITSSFESMLDNPEFYTILKELVEFGIQRYQSSYSTCYQDTSLVLYQKYTYEDVCRLLNWEKNEIPVNMGGYKYDHQTKTLPVFVNYDKEEDIQDTIKYEDHFISDSKLITISKQNRTIESKDVQNFLYSQQRGIKVELFVRKNKIDKEFYYLGSMIATDPVREFVMNNTDKTAVEINWVMDTPVREDIYEYITNG
jgi:hypothetical protein